MSVESASFISQLNPTYPAATDLLSEGDNHIRLTKQVLQNQFTSLGVVAVTATAAQLNFSVGVTSAIQTQLNTLSASISSAGAVAAWVSGTSYAIGAAVYSPITLQTYRARAATSGTTDPSLDPTNWEPLGPLVLPMTTIAISTAAARSNHYIITASLTLTLPPSPSVNDVVQFTDLSLTNASIVDPGANKIRGQSGTMTLNTKYADAMLKYSGSTNGWI